MVEVVHTIMLHEPKGELSAHVERVSRGGNLFYAVEGMKGKPVFYKRLPPAVKPHLRKLKLLPDPELAKGARDARHPWIKLPDAKHGYKIKKNADGTNKVVVEITQDDYAKIVVSNRVYDANRLVAKFLWKTRKNEQLTPDVKRKMRDIAERLLFVFDYPRSKKNRKKAAEVVWKVVEHVDNMDPRERRILADVLNHDKTFRAIRQKHGIDEFDLDDIEKVLDKKYNNQRGMGKGPAQTESPYLDLREDINRFFKNKRMYVDGEDNRMSSDEQSLLPILLTLHKQKSKKPGKEVFHKNGEVLVPIKARKGVSKGVGKMEEEDIPAFVEFLNNHEVMKSLREEYGVPEFTNEEVLGMKRLWGSRVEE